MEMEQTVESEIVPVIPVSEANRNPDSAAMSLTGDTNADLAAIAKEMGLPESAVQDVQHPERITESNKRPQMPTAALPQVEVEAQPEVPAKFQNPDGTVNVEKVEKSTKSAEEMIAYYKAKEREANQAMNRVNNPPAPQPQSVQPNQPLTPLEYQMAQDLINEVAAQGIRIDETEQRRAIAQARVMARGLEAKHGAELSVTQELQRRLEDNERTRELQGMLDGDQNLLTPEMADKLWSIRQSNPWINQAPQPWQAAYVHYLGTQGRAGQVQTPTPKGTTAKAPATPVGPVTRVLPTVTTNPRQMTDAQLAAEIRKMHPGFRG